MLGLPQLQPLRKRSSSGRNSDPRSSLNVMADFLHFAGKTFLVFGVANRKSVAWHIAKTLENEGATVVYSVRSEARKKSLDTLLAGKPVFLCDVEEEGAPERLAAEVAAAGHTPLQGIV